MNMKSDDSPALPRVWLAVLLAGAGILLLLLWAGSAGS